MRHELVREQSQGPVVRSGGRQALGRMRLEGVTTTPDVQLCLATRGKKRQGEMQRSRFGRTVHRLYPFEKKEITRFDGTL
jgi:hypothetical protein